MTKVILHQPQHQSWLWSEDVVKVNVIATGWSKNVANALLSNNDAKYFEYKYNLLRIACQEIT